MKRIPSLDGLRAISILLVVAGHMARSGHAPQIFWACYAEIGVRIFFVISGYLITGILLREHEQTSTISLREFYIRRAFRIFPAALVFLLVVFVFYWHQLRWFDIAAALLYVANMDPWRPWILGHLWSLSLEEQFYLLWPGVLKRWYRHRAVILLGVFALAPVFQAAMYALKFRSGAANTLPAISNNLAIGGLLALFGARIPTIKPYLAIIMTAVVIATPLYSSRSAIGTLFGLFVLRPLLYVAIAGIVLHVVQTPYWVLNCRPVAWLGKISYSLYLWQQPFCADPHLRSAYLAVFAFLCATVSYYFVEQPLLRIRDQRSQRAAKKPVRDSLSPAAAA
jgi:peptidoglycan/LPS O-acetylase OafA/YrhL